MSLQRSSWVVALLNFLPVPSACVVASVSALLVLISSSDRLSSVLLRSPGWVDPSVSVLYFSSSFFHGSHILNWYWRGAGRTSPFRRTAPAQKWKTPCRDGPCLRTDTTVLRIAGCTFKNLVVQEKNILKLRLNLLVCTSVDKTWAIY